MSTDMEQLFDRLRSRVASRMPDTKLRKTRPGGWNRVNFGEYWLWDWRRNCVVESHVDLLELDARLSGRGVVVTANGGDK